VIRFSVVRTGNRLSGAAPRIWGLAPPSDFRSFATMTLSRRIAAFAVLCCLSLGTQLAFAQPASGGRTETLVGKEPMVAEPAAPKPAPYDARLMRMAEILGSVTYIRTICADPGAEGWRADMQALINREAGAEADRKARLTAAYNRGYRSFAAVYTLCTASAVLADRRYRDEGATLAAEIVSRFGN
jgi:uncharacterized protein (TIGR02301 family)